MCCFFNIFQSNFSTHRGLSNLCLCNFIVIYQLLIYLIFIFDNKNFFFFYQLRYPIVTLS